MSDDKTETITKLKAEIQTVQAELSFGGSFVEAMARTARLKELERLLAIATEGAAPEPDISPRREARTIAPASSTPRGWGHSAVDYYVKNR
jgi:hypothetical protein